MITRTRAVIFAIAALPLAACANVHPGAAAVVDGETISMTRLNETAQAYCDVTIVGARQQGQDAISNAQLKAQAINTLVSLTVGRAMAEDGGLQIDDAEFRLSDAELDDIARAFPEGDNDQIVAAIEDSQELAAIAVALGAESAQAEATSENSADLAQRGQAAIVEAYPDYDVQFAPRLGLDSTGTPQTPTGSISVSAPEDALPIVEQLPDAQRCS